MMALMRRYRFSLGLALGLVVGALGMFYLASPRHQLQFIPLATLPTPAIEPDLARFYPPSLAGLVPLSIAPLSLQRDLSAMDNPTLAAEIQNAVLSKSGILYIEPRERTNVVVLYEVYKLSSAAEAEKLLEAYKAIWNKFKLTLSGHEIWIWAGYMEQTEPPFPAGVPIYWDPAFQEAFLPMGDEQGEEAVSIIGSDLYCMHGETIEGQYFIMIDVHAPYYDVDGQAREIFTSALASFRSS